MSPNVFSEVTRAEWASPLNRDVFGCSASTFVPSRAMPTLPMPFQRSRQFPWRLPSRARLLRASASGGFRADQNLGCWVGSGFDPDRQLVAIARRRLEVH